MGSIKSKALEWNKSALDLFKHDQYTLPTINMNIKLQMMYILHCWVRHMQHRNLSTSELPQDILRLIIDRFCYHPIFDIEFEQKLTCPESYFNQQYLSYSQNNDGSIVLKLLLIGDHNVGKSKLVSRYRHNKWDEDAGYTMGVDLEIKTLIIDNCKVRLQLWDISGVDRQDKCIAPYYKVAHAVILTYDITNRQSFDRIYPHWNDLVDKRVRYKMVHKLLIGTKLDAVEYENVDEIVSTKEGQELAMKLNAVGFVEVSAKLGVNVNNAFNDFVRYVIRDKQGAEKRKQYPFAD